MIEARAMASFTPPVVSTLSGRSHHFEQYPVRYSIAPRSMPARFYNADAVDSLTLLQRRAGGHGAQGVYLSRVIPHH